MAHRLVDPLGSLDSGQENPLPLAPLHVLLPGYGREALDRFQEDHIILPERLPLVPVQRLFVLIAENDFDDNKLSQRLWNLAVPGALAVSLVGLSAVPGAEYFLRIRLATIAANTRDRSVHVDTRVLPGDNWIQAVKDILRPADLIICLEHHRVNSGVLRRPVSLEISSFLDNPVYILTGCRLGPAPGYSNLVKEVVLWLVAFGFIAIFAWLQILIDQAIQGWHSDLLLILTVIMEFLLIWKLHEITS